MPSRLSPFPPFFGIPLIRPLLPMSAQDFETDFAVFPLLVKENNLREDPPQSTVLVSRAMPATESNLNFSVPGFFRRFPWDTLVQIASRLSDPLSTRFLFAIGPEGTFCRRPILRSSTQKFVLNFPLGKR